MERILIRLLWIFAVSFTAIRSSLAVTCGQESDDKLYVWVDDAPDCEADSSYCPHFGLEYVCESKFISFLPNATCKSGTKVRCSFPDQTVPLETTPVDVIKVLAYNVYELRYLYFQSGQRERTCRVVPEVLKMHPDLDVIVFNEVFMGGCFPPDADITEDNKLTIRQILEQYGFPHYTKTVGSWEPTKRQPENGGIFIASKWPIVKNDSMVFETLSTQGDSLMRKGVSYARVMKSVEGKSTIYNIFGTHLQAYERTNTSLIRVLQAGEMYDFMKQQDISPNEPVIYAGDLNADSANKPNHSAEVIDALHATLPTITGELEFTYDRVENDVFDGTGSDRKWLDYVLYSYEHQQPNTATLEPVRPKSAEPMELCMSAVAITPCYGDSDRCREFWNVSDLSDHYAVLGTFSFPYAEETSTERQPSTPQGRASYTRFCPFMIFFVLLAFKTLI
ncbi:hypothetical protein HOLleu_07910 [Holothuria leucospilota]|uniref:sphingomyelin phosphodiesterase n=1 Tax=Holothuria leucospilota TaxID=206669 RepID=A0A9Q1CHF1_HOLLE|nr:hypothetical protein HOLleu_07910 [Holothuria leucospilota]